MRLFLALPLIFAYSYGYGQCKGIQKRINTAKQKITFYSEGYNEPTYLPVNFMRTDRVNGFQSTTIDLILRVKGDSTATQQGLWLIFSDGSRLAWPDRFVGFKTEQGLSLWWASAPLTPAQMTQLSTKLISEIKIYQYEQSLSRAQAEQARTSFNCIQAAK